MANLTLHATSGPDGVLRLAIPVDVPGATYDVHVSLSSAQSSAQLTAEPVQAGQTAPMTPEQWSEWRAFITRTAGSLADDPIERPAQGEYEQRESVE